MQHLFPKKNVGRDIGFALTVKLIALTLLWALFFSHPRDESLSKPELVTHYLIPSSELAHASVRSAPSAQPPHA